MRNLINLIFRYSAFIVFILFEIICFYLIVNYNKSQKEIWAHSSNLFTGSVNQKMDRMEGFLRLQDLNDSLLAENAKLLQTILNYRIHDPQNNFQTFEESYDDSTAMFTLIPAQVVSKTVHLRNNFLTLSKGSIDGLHIGMGVVTDNGVIGIIKSVSDHFATVLMVINSQSRISAKVLNKNYHGNMVWTSSDPRIMKLKDIPKHANISVGDSIVTSGYSISFPPLIPIGIVEDIKVKEGGNSFDIDLSLGYDLTKIENVMVVKMPLAEEKEKTLSSQDE